jgi:LysM repeat protein
MKQVALFCGIIVFLLSACNLDSGSGENTPLPVASITPIGGATTTVTPTSTGTTSATATQVAVVVTSTPIRVNPPIVVTATPIRTNPPVVVPTSCTPRRDWYSYTVQRGDTLFSIARRANSTVAILAAANCLSNPENISAGQVLAVPNEIRNTDNVVYWLQTNTRSPGSIVVACDAIVAPTQSTTARTADAATNIRNSLNALFTTGSSTNNLWAGQGLSVQGVTVTNGRANITVTGGLSLTGACADGVMQAQFLLSVFGEAQVQSAYVTVDGQNLVQIFDMSGLEPADAVFTPADVPVVN